MEAHPKKCGGFVMRPTHYPRCFGHSLNVGDLAGEKAFRRGPWKFVQPRNRKQPGDPMLFNLDEDLAKAHDLADRYPERLAELMPAHAAIAASISKQSAGRR